MIKGIRRVRDITSTKEEKTAISTSRKKTIFSLKVMSM
ncbi:hypothetical protein HPCPY1962_1473 [Helicobacter pylori CPY1962]|nr:hypothetical protein HPCPY1962_1473 [Helicobacter pylori CPY1962]